MDPDLAAPHQPYGSGFTAFVLLQKTGYDLYALARLGDPELGCHVVRCALRSTAEHWDRVLRQRHAVAYAWRTLRNHVTAACVYAPDPTTDRLHRRLPAAHADVELLHRLGLSVAQAADLMGLEASEAAADLRMARRTLHDTNPWESVTSTC